MSETNRIELRRLLSVEKPITREGGNKVILNYY